MDRPHIIRPMSSVLGDEAKNIASQPTELIAKPRNIVILRPRLSTMNIEPSEPIARANMLIEPELCSTKARNL